MIDMSRMKGLALIVSMAAGMPTYADTPVPKDLEGWKGWVLDQQEFLRCPFFSGTDGATVDRRVCMWPGRLDLDLNKSGGHFSQSWFSENDAWISLPGSSEFWPRNITVNGKAAPVIERDGVPNIRVTQGSFTIAGNFVWTKRPESLPIPASSGLVALKLDGQKIDQVDRPAGAVWLGKRHDAEVPQQIDVQVYRLLSDGVPMMLATRLHLQVAGDAREELLSQALPMGFAPTALDSPLPARLDPNGRLRVQVRAGTWDIALSARAIGSTDKIAIPNAVGSWPKQEVWSFAADDRLRVAAVEGAEGIDPAQANVPTDWRAYPSFRFLPGDAVNVAERARGLSSDEGNHLVLKRHLYLDFAHNGFTVIDRIAGSMRTGWRLDMHAPFRLLNVTSREGNLLVTQGADPALSGVELRSPQVQLSSAGRIDVAGGSIAASGWTEHFDHVSGVLHVPPGHRLLAAIGADDAPGAWVERWGLLDLFLLLITSVLVLRAVGYLSATITFMAVVLLHQENATLVWLILLTVLVILGLRVMPAAWPRRTFVVVRNVMFAFLIWTVVPFAVTQVRYAFYPQLTDPGGYAAVDEGTPMNAITSTTSVNAPAPAAEIAQIDALQDLQMNKAVGGNGTFAPPPPPKLGAPRQDAGRLEELSVTAQRRADSFTSSRYAPGTVVQAGRGRPHWHFANYAYGWSGPVDAAQSVHFLILGPWLMGLWRILGVGLLVWLTLRLIRDSIDVKAEWQRLTAERGAAVTTVMLLCILGSHGTTARATDIPNPNLLGELKARLTRPAKCLPTCAEIMSAELDLKPAELAVTLNIAALTSVAVALPSATTHFEPTAVSIDGSAAPGVFRDSNQQYWIALKPGVHVVRLSGHLPANDSIQLSFPQVPRTIAVRGEGWEVSGTNAGRLLGNTLELVRRHAAASDLTTAHSSSQFAPFVRVHRDFALDLDWSLQTTVERLAPEKGGFTLAIPLLAGESVLSDGIELRDNQRVLASFDSNADDFKWQSALSSRETMTLTASKDGAWTEVWSFHVSPIWRVAFTGLPAVLPDQPDAGDWSFEYYPRPGERLTFTVTRPAAAKGETLAIDTVSAMFNIGKRSTDASLQFAYRSTQGGRHSIGLPHGAHVTAVTVDGATVPVRPEKGQLPLALLPGPHRVQVNWQSDGAIELGARAPAVDLGIESSNVITQLSLPADRWVLFAGGTGVGPAILYWGEMIVFVVIAVALGRTRGFQLKTYEWLLLGLGLSTFSWAVLLLFVVWMFALRWRERFAVEALSDTTFRLMQVGLIVLSVAAIVTLVGAIPYGLLAAPDMRIAGVDQTSSTLNWFNDQAAGPLPTPWVLSLSLWWYKLAMLLWALWLALALVKWLPKAWRALNVGGIWRSRKPPPASTPAPSEATTPPES